MVGTIVPVVYGQDRKRWAPAVAHVTGTIAGGAAVGAALGYLGSTAVSGSGVTGPYAIAALGTLALLLAPAEAELLGLRVPQLRRQVTQRWRRHAKPWITALAYGLELGAGVTTFVPTTTFYVVAGGAFLMADAVLGATVMGAFGAARGAPVLLLAAIPRELDGVIRFGDGLPGWEPLVRLVNALLLAAAGAYLIGTNVIVDR